MSEYTIDRWGVLRRDGRIMSLFPKAWTFSVSWRGRRFGLVLMPDGYFFIGFFTVTP